MTEEKSESHFEIYSRFDYGNNPAFDELVKNYTSEVSGDHAAGRPVIPFTEYVMAWVAESNQAYSHADFVAAIQRNTATIRWLVEPYKMIRGRGGHVFGILTLLYQAAPLVIFSICAYMTRNWWLLLGTMLSYKASGFAARNYNANTKARPNKFFAGFLLFLLSATVAFWFYTGFHGYLFWPFAALWGFTFYILAELAQMTNRLDHS
ncbi:MAG: hypothetical protein WA183_11765 [Chthoniobacterales bacterium]